MGKAPAFPFSCPNDANLWFPLITDSRLSGAVCCKPACSSNPALSGRSGNGILFLRRAHAEPPLYHAGAVQTVRRNQGRRVVLTSAFFPFSIEILNTGSAAVPPPSGTGEKRILWASCNVNCGSRCALRVPVKGGEITHMETDNTGDERYGMQQIRACPLGRSMRQRIHAEQRIPYPLYRVATGWKEVRAHQMGGTLRGDRTEAARNHRHLQQRGRPSELRHGCDRQYHRQKTASGRYARCPAHESCRRLQTVVRVAAAA